MKNMYFEPTYERTAILDKAPIVDTKNMMLPEGIQCIKDTQKLSEKDKAIIGYNDYAVILANGRYIGINPGPKGIEFEINTFYIESIKEALGL